MNNRLELVSDRSADRRGAEAPPAPRSRSARADRIAPVEPGGELAFLEPSRRRVSPRLRRLLDEERGAVTAEYAIVIMAAVAFAGLLVAIMRSEEIRVMLVGLVENALGTGG